VAAQSHHVDTGRLLLFSEPGVGDGKGDRRKMAYSPNSCLVGACVVPAIMLPVAKP